MQLRDTYFTKYGRVWSLGKPSRHCRSRGGHRALDNCIPGARASASTSTTSKAATQKPSGDTIPTYLRDLFAVRWAFRCSTSDASDTILGKGWARAGYSADTIDVAHRGVGYLLHEGGRPVRLRTFYLADLELYALAAHAELVRATHRDRALEEGGAATHLHVTE